MAKKKAVSSGSNRKSTKANAQQSANSKPTARTLGATLPVRHRILSNDQIGQVAGKVWQLLAEEGDQSLTSIKKSIGGSDVVVLAAVGWLAREGKLEFLASGRSMKVSLR